LQIEGRQLEVAWWGPATSAKLPIVLLHEGLGSVSLWRDFPGALAQITARRVMAYSRFGHGRSDPAPAPRTPWFMHEEARLLPVILATAGIARAILLGHSDGASIALIAAAQSPERVEGLILEAPHVFVEEMSVATIQERTAAFDDPAADFRRRLARHHDDVDAAFRGWSSVWLDPAFRDWNIEEYVPGVACPALLVQGEDDQYGSLHQIEAIERRLGGPATRLVLSDCGHSPHRHQQDAVLGAVAAFLAPLH
jgi:pimeloyl-ACP methyl ester carboxylesterase